MIKPAFWKKTNYQIQGYRSAHRADLEQFCLVASAEQNKQASANMDFARLLHVIEGEQRFQKGEFLLFKVNDRIVAVSGYHPLDLDLDPNSYVCGVRTYTLAEYEHFGIHSNFLLPYQLDKVLTAPERQALLVFNEYNEKIFHFVESLVTLLNRRSEIELKSQPLPKRISYKNTVQFGVLIYHHGIRFKPFEKLFI